MNLKKPWMTNLKTLYCLERRTQSKVSIFCCLRGTDRVGTEGAWLIQFKPWTTRDVINLNLDRSLCIYMSIQSVSVCVVSQSKYLRMNWNCVYVCVYTCNCESMQYAIVFVLVCWQICSKAICILYIDLKYGMTSLSQHSQFLAAARDKPPNLTLQFSLCEVQWGQGPIFTQEIQSSLFYEKFILMSSCWGCCHKRREKYIVKYF